MMKKALIYSLSLALLLSLTACRKPQADQPSEPDPAVTSAPADVSTPETTPEPSEQTTPEPTQPPEPTPTDTVEPQAPEETEPAQATASELTPVSETKPTTQKPSTNTGTGSTGTTTPPSTGGSQVTDDVIQAQIEAAIRQAQEGVANGEVSASGERTQGGFEEIGNRLSGGDGPQQQTPPSTGSQGSTGQTQTPPSTGGNPFGDISGGGQVSTGNPELDAIFNGTEFNPYQDGRGDVDENGNVSNAGLNVQ